MAKKCDLCGRGATKGASRSHSKIQTLKRQNINLQSKVIEGVKVKVCTSCMRTLAKPVRVKAKRKPALKVGEAGTARKTGKKIVKVAKVKKTAAKK
ncbi:MAG: 50S ribosomal protein L28 [Candidatus Falkowbacteria bacterium]|nr:MAG: 50S ribosomal protein L28 [Candidatus Falkowbacteria bacterium]